MSKKHIAKKRPSNYNPAFTRDEAVLNEVREQLTFHDYLETLRTVAYAAGQIASMVQVHEALSKPYIEVKKLYQQAFDGVANPIDEMGEKVVGKKKWDEIMFNAELERMSGGDGHLKPPKPKQKESQ